MKAALLIISAILIIGFLPFAVASIEEFRSVDYSEPHIVDTGIGETDADVVLSQDLFNDATANVSLSSDNGDDAPIPSAYTAATHTLNISGLADDDSRTMTITYKIGALDDYFGADLGARMWPTMLILCVIGLMGAGVYDVTRRGG